MKLPRPGHSGLFGALALGFVDGDSSVVGRCRQLRPGRMTPMAEIVADIGGASSGGLFLSGVVF